MSFDLEFEPQTEEQVLNVWPEGEYDYFVKKSEPWVSQKTGKSSIKLTLSLVNDAGEEKTQNVWLSSGFMFLVKHFADSAGEDLVAKYKVGGYNAADCQDRSGRLFLGKEDNNGRPQNVVRDFLKATHPKASSPQQPLDDKLPAWM